ncbi:MAG: cyclopropane fatty acyl phospholipid synthase [Adhaeribacter sp.]
MSTAPYQQQLTAILDLAGIQVNGPQPWDMQVHDERLYRRVLSQGTLGLGEAYMDGWWDCDQLDACICRILRADLYKTARFSWNTKLKLLAARFLNLQSLGLAAKNARRHYDLGNQLYELMLDKRMTYSCGYWKGAQTLDQAQENKLDLICRKLNLQAGQRVLDIGCGWGSFAGFAAERYGVEVVGVTVSRPQAELARERYRGLPVEIRLQDYRQVRGRFDHVVSVGMAEHVGRHNYRTYMQVAANCLQDDGLFLLHTIGMGYSRKAADPFTDKYIFPNCLIPSLRQLTAAMEHVFVVEDLHNFGTDYDYTLQAWFENFHENWGLLAPTYGERFYRMWRYYLLTCAGGFRARHNHLWQLVLSKKGLLGGYTPVR